MSAARSRSAHVALDNVRCYAADAALALDELAVNWMVPADHPALVHAVETIRDVRREIAKAAALLSTKSATSR
jgi:hypothetical protein